MRGEWGRDWEVNGVGRYNVKLPKSILIKKLLKKKKKKRP